MESPTLETQPRAGRGSRASRKLRTQGLVPAVVYGHKEEAVSVALPQKELQNALRHHARVVDLRIGGQSQTAVIQEIQYDHLGNDVLHVDLKRVSRDERIAVTVTIELKGVPAGIGHGQILQQPMHELEVECPAFAIPETIRINIADLKPGQPIHVSDVVLPAEVKALNAPDLVVVQLTAAEDEPETTPAGAEPGATSAEPEIVGRRVAKEEGEE